MSQGILGIHDPPGFAIDESVENLGIELKLPEWLESNRSILEPQLPLIHLPKIAR